MAQESLSAQRILITENNDNGKKEWIWWQPDFKGGNMLTKALNIFIWSRSIDLWCKILHPRR